MFVVVGMGDVLEELFEGVFVVDGFVIYDFDSCFMNGVVVVIE